MGIMHKGCLVEVARKRYEAEICVGHIFGRFNFFTNKDWSTISPLQ